MKNVQVIEEHTENGVDWFVSFTSNNPEADDCVKMASKEDAFRLHEILTKRLDVCYRPLQVDFNTGVHK